MFGFDFFKEFEKRRVSNVFNSNLSQKHGAECEYEYFRDIINNYDIKYYHCNCKQCNLCYKTKL